MVHNKYMQGGLDSGKNLGALTAYVMTAMLEAGVDRNVSHGEMVQVTEFTGKSCYSPSVSLRYRIP